MGELIRFVSSQWNTLWDYVIIWSEFCNPVEKLRDKDQAKMDTLYYGLCPFNYVAQPEDGVTALFPRIEIMTNGLSNGVPYLTAKTETEEK
jgi:hypothetical protein